MLCGCSGRRLRIGTKEIINSKELKTMNASDFLKKFRDQFDETDPESIELSTVYKDLDEWSSLIAFTVIAMVKVEYNKTVTGAELRHCNTVEDLFNLVAAK